MHYHKIQLASEHHAVDITIAICVDEINLERSTVFLKPYLTSTSPLALTTAPSLHLPLYFFYRATGPAGLTKVNIVQATGEVEPS